MECGVIFCTIIFSLCLLSIVDYYVYTCPMHKKIKEKKMKAEMIALKEKYDSILMLVKERL